MILKDAIIEGGNMWKTAYPVICSAVIELLKEEDVGIDGAYMTREVQDALLVKSGLPENAANRRVIYKALTNNTEDGRCLENYHSRVSERVAGGRTVQAYRWHMPDNKATLKRLKAKKALLVDELSALDCEIAELDIEIASIKKQEIEV